MMHPDISPNQFEEGIKNGHYMVNLSVNQTFSPPEFHASEDPQNNADNLEEEHMHENRNVLHSDNDEIESQFEESQSEDEDSHFDSTRDRDPNDDISENEDEESNEDRHQGDRKQIYRQNANAEISNIDSFQKFTSSQASSSSSQVSTSRSIIAAMKRAILQSRSHSSSSSTTGDLTTSNFSRNPEPFGFDPQLLPIRIDEGLIWDTPLYNFSAKFLLHTLIRQVVQKLIDVFNKVRVCNFDKGVVKLINSRTVPKSNLPANCLCLYTARSNVDRANIKEFKRLEGESVAIPAFDIYNGGNRKGWVNGTLARVSKVNEENILLVKQEAEGTQESLWIQRISRSIPGTSYVRTQSSIVPAFATTIHKAQSITIESVAIHLDHMPSHGQMYVAMSRVHKADGLYFFETDIPVRIKEKARY
ncbi:hypothetical protein G6F43_009970 [Rhizopus delemar]|nr:hypothetical protein G6F43_009970 [Rhizopus delemar]